MIRASDKNSRRFERNIANNMNELVTSDREVSPNNTKFSV